MAKRADSVDLSGNWEPKADPDAKLTKKQVEELHKRLVEEQARLLAGIRRHVNEATEDETRLPDEADLASRHANQAYLLRVADKEYKLLRQVQRAMVKMKSGEYGICEGNSEPIGYKRLQLRPWTRYSVHYKEELEREKTQNRRG